MVSVSASTRTAPRLNLVGEGGEGEGVGHVGFLVARTDGGKPWL